MAVLILVAMSWGAFEAARAFESERIARRQATLSFNVLFNVEQSFTALLEAETSQRGYILTARDVYLSPYRTSTEKFEIATTKLAKLIEDEPTRTETELAERLAALGKEKLAEVAANIDLVADGRQDEALTQTNTDAGEDLMESIRTIVGQFEAYELQLLNSAVARADSVQRRATGLLVLLALGVLSLFAILAYNIWRAARLSVVEDNLAVVEAERAKTEVLARELNHRVKNLFAIVLSLIRNTGRGESDARTASDKIHARVQALARAHELTSRIDGAVATNLKDLLTAILQPYASETNRLELAGPHVDVTAEQVTPLGLVANELATNAVKYGAWSGTGGLIRVDWDASPAEGVDISWRETGGAPHEAEGDPKSGFGSRLIDVSIQQLGGTFRQNWDNGRLTMSIHLPSYDETNS